MICKCLFSVFALCALVFAQGQANLSGTVTSQSGTPIEGASILLLNQGLEAQTDAQGHYQITGALSAQDRNVSPVQNVLRLYNGRISFMLESFQNVRIDIHDMSGKLISNAVNGQLRPGVHNIPLCLTQLANSVFLIRARFGSQEYAYRYVPFFGLRPYTLPASKSQSLAKTAGVVDYIMASKTGYTPKQIAIESFTGVVDIVLDSISTGGSNPIDDGSAQRIAEYGESQYFYGDWGDGDVPIVKITHAVVGDLVDAELIFNPGFTDNTYGANSIGWNPNRPHTLRDIYQSDHVQVAFLNGDGETVLEIKLDLLTESLDAPSGYAALGPYGGDGLVISGDATAVLSWGTSMDDNFNYYGYYDSLTMENCPPTDSIYTPNPDYPNWQYYAVYRVTLDQSIFGPSGYGGVFMTSVHASPSKGTETVPVVEKPGPTPGSPDDPFKYYNPPGTVPPDTTTPPDTGDTAEIPV